MKKRIYEWKENCRIKTNAKIVGQELEKISKNGPFSPKIVVESAKREKSPLHNEFEWNDKIAGGLYRIEQAKYIIRNITVKIVDDEKGVSPTTRGYISIGNGILDGKESRYYDVEMVVNDADLRKRAIQKVWNQLLRIKSQYETLAEFADVWSAIESTQQNLLEKIG